MATVLVIGCRSTVLTVLVWKQLHVVPAIVEPLLLRGFGRQIAYSK